MDQTTRHLDRTGCHDAGQQDPELRSGLPAAMADATHLDSEIDFAMDCRLGRRCHQDSTDHRWRSTG